MLLAVLVQRAGTVLYCILVLAIPQCSALSGVCWVTTRK